jgi:phenylpropionate dioxygenase-like ring-hydroxylating dioxygenase large terminal subunit
VKNVLPPKNYYDPAVFAEEMRSIFAPCWIFAGVTDDLAQPDAWIATRIGDTSVTLQREGETLHAVQNVCSHRFAVLREQAKGCGPLKCPYHGWMFHGNGEIAAIPARPRFADLDEKAIAGLSLTRYDVATCGRLIFVKLQPGGPGLREYCGEAWEPLQQFSEALGTQIQYAVVPVAANWKLVVENSIESYHAGSVHPETLGADRSYRFKIRTGPSFTNFEEAISTASAAKWKRVKQAFASRPVATDDYIFYSLFPTFSIDTHRGAIFAVNVVHPLAPTRTEIHSRIYATRLGSPELEQSALVRAFNSYSASGAPMVVNQDRMICENVQIGIQQADRPALLSEEEERIHAFQSTCERHLRAGSPSFAGGLMGL